MKPFFECFIIALGTFIIVSTFISKAFWISAIFTVIGGLYIGDVLKSNGVSL